MLVLPFARHDGLFAIEDDSSSERVHVALNRPRVARRADGSPRMKLLRWVAPAGSDAEAPTVGGRLSLDVLVQPTDAEIAAAGLGARTALPVPWLDAALRLEGPELEPVEAEVSVVAGATAAVSINLSPTAAAVLEPLLLADVTSPLQVTWTGHVRVRLPAVEVSATADIDEIRRRVETVRGTTRTVALRSVIEANAKIEISGAGDPALEKALSDWAMDELARRVEDGEDLSIHAAASDVVRWPIQLATTLDDFAPPGERQDLVETLILDPGEVGATPPTEVRVIGDFAGPLERVDLRLRPPSGDTVELALTDEAPRSVALGTASFSWSHRVKLTAGSAGDWSSWKDVEGSYALLVPVPAPASLEIEVLSAGLDFDSRWASVRVALEHRAPGSQPARHTVELTSGRSSAIWDLLLAGVRGTLSATMTYVSLRGLTVERTVSGISENQVIVEDPFASQRIELAVVPAGGGWSEVALAMVDLRYADGALTFDETIELRALDDFVQWQAPARMDGPSEIRWRLHTSFADGRFESADWQTTTAGVLVVRIEGAPRREVQVLPIYFDAEATSRATVELRSEARAETVVVTSREQQAAILPPGPFTWSVRWTLADGTETAASDQGPGDDVIVLPRFRPT